VTVCIDDVIHMLDELTSAVGANNDGDQDQPPRASPAGGCAEV
jgi:hypothetical protein